MFCHKCGIELLDSAQYCHKCGANMSTKDKVCDMRQSSGSDSAENGQNSTFMWILVVIVIILLLTSKLWDVQ